MKRKLFLTVALLSASVWAMAQFTPTAQVEHPLPVQKIQKSASNWDVQFATTVTPACVSPIGMTSDGNYLYAGSASKAILYKIGFDSKLVDSTNINGLFRSSYLGSYCIGLAYDGQYLYLANGNDTIYRLSTTKDKVEETIVLPEGTHAAALAYDPNADNGNGGFWVTCVNHPICLFSKTGNLLKTITLEDLNYEAAIWGLAYDAENGNLFALERYPQNILRINTTSKSINAPLHCVSDDKTAWANYYAYGIYIQHGMHSDTTTTLGIFFMSRYHIGYEFNSVNTLDDDGAELLTTKMEKYQKVNTPKTISAILANRGSHAIQSYVFHYSVEDTVYSDTVTGKNLTDYVTGSVITHALSFTPKVCDKIYDMKLWISDINGSGISTDTLTFSFETYLKGCQRMVLHEAFSSATCSPCKAGNANLKSIFDTHDNWVCIKYQMIWPGNGDPYYTPEGNTRRNYYNVSSVPYLAADGKYFKGSSTTYTSDYLEAEIPKPSLVEMEGSLLYDNNKTFTAEIKATPYKSLSGDIRLYAALVENKTRNNIADEYLSYYGASTFYANWDSVFHCVMKKFLTPATGTRVTLKEDSTITFNLEYTFNGDYRLPQDANDYIDHEVEHSVENFNHVFVVYWLQNYRTQEVLQAGKAGEAATGIATSSSSLARVRVYPNPSSNQMNIRSDIPFTTVRLINMAGQCVFQANANGEQYQLNVQDYASGLYILQLHTANGTVNTKVQIR